LGKSALSAWVLDWLQTVENQSGVAPLIYTNYNYVSNFLTDPVADYDLWIAYLNCDPNPTFNIPPTGMWSDWGFWQYCVKSAGFVPGIHTPIDVNIFNGVEEGLSEFDAASPLWVSLTNYTNAGPAPHYADITADVNGDASGPIDFSFWWDCASLEVDIAAVSASCGALLAPADPTDGECLENEYGVRCSVIAEEVKIVEHTYQEIGDYTAKVIVERDTAPPAEDRYQISVYNPILSLTADPVSPAGGIINQPFELTASVEIKTSISGALQVDLIEDGTGTVKGTGCQTVPHDSLATRNFDFSLLNSEVTIQDYTLWARYRASQECPILDLSADDQPEPYSINWRAGTLADFDGDGDTDISVYNESTGIWKIYDQSYTNWGYPEDLPVPGDYDGNGETDIAILRPSNGNWYIKDQGKFSWYYPGDIPVQADYDGDGVVDIAVLRPSTGRWYIQGLGNFKFFEEGDIPVPCDYDGDGADEIAVFSPSNNQWHIFGQDPIVWAQAGDIPVPADYDGNGTCDIAVFRPLNGFWYVKDQGITSWGFPDDIPVPGDYNRDGRAEMAVIRPSTGKWYIEGMGNFSWYQTGDYPLPVRDTNADGDPYH